MKFGLFFNARIGVEATLSVAALLGRLRHTVYFYQEQVKYLPKRVGGEHVRDFAGDAHQVDFLIVLGGDGTVLRAARLIAGTGIPILGINLGKIGFLTEATLTDIARCVTRIEKKKFLLDERMLLSVEVTRGGKLRKQLVALNEAVIGVVGRPRLVRLVVSLDKREVAHYSADGLIVATPTGSTGHSFSAGGPILEPTTRAVVLTPISPHSLNGRALVIPYDREVPRTLQIVSGKEKVLPLLMTVDGQESIELTQEDIVTTTQSPKTVQFVRFRPFDFFRAMRLKLGWL